MIAALQTGRVSFWHCVLTAALLLAFADFVRADAIPAKQRIVVIPFVLLNAKPDQAWISKALQDNTVAELGRSPYLMPVAHAGALPNADAPAAARIARAADAPYAVYGSAQILDQTIRITAQLVDSRTGDAVGTAASTGPLSDLLRLEDDIVTQLRPIAATESSATATATVQPAPQPQAPPAAPAPAAPAGASLPIPTPVLNLSLAAQTLQNNAPAYQNYPSYDSYAYPYSYGYYPYGGYSYISPIYYPAYSTGYHHHHFYSSGLSLTISTGPSYGPLTPGPAAAAPGVSTISPGVGSISPGVGGISPGVSSMSPGVVTYSALNNFNHLPTAPAASRYHH